MKSRREVLCGAAALLASGCASMRPPGARLQSLTEGAGQVLGVAVIARDGAGRVRFAEAAGSAVRGEGEALQARPFTLDDPVRVASISKLAATAGFMTLVERGLVRLDDDVSPAVGFRLRHPAHAQVAITPSMLLSHTSGLRDSPNYPLPLGKRLQDAFTPGTPEWEEGAWWSPASEPPGYFTYGNVNFAVLAQMIERIAGERFDRFMAATVFRPLGLDAGYNWSGVNQAKRDRASAACVIGHEGMWSPQVDGVVPPAPAIRMYAPGRPQLTADDYRIGENGWAFSPQGGLRASTRDLDVLAQLFARGGAVGGMRLLKAETVRRMQAPVWTYDGRNGNTDLGLMRSYGLSVQALTGAAGPDGDAFFGPGSRDWRGHLGEAYGLVSGLWWNVRDGRTLAYVINGTPADAATTPGRRSALSPWEEDAIDAGLGA